jgi:hypothetical protein
VTGALCVGATCSAVCFTSTGKLHERLYAPHTFKLSTDPQFIDKVRDIVGLYLNPPKAALVLCVDEKTQVQALDRTAPVLPLLPGVAERRTHDYRRHGTTNLYAALDVASGKVICDLTGRHRAIEFRRFWPASTTPCRLTLAYT